MGHLYPCARSICCHGTAREPSRVSQRRCRRPKCSSVESPCARGDRRHRPPRRSRHAGHSVAMFRDKFWLELRPDDPGCSPRPGGRRVARYAIPDVPLIEACPRSSARLMHSTEASYSSRRPGRAGRPLARNDDPDLARNRRRLRHVVGRHAWAVRGRDLVGTRRSSRSCCSAMLEMRSIAQARGALAALAELLPDTAERVTSGGTEEVALAALREGDVVLVSRSAGSCRRRRRGRNCRRRRSLITGLVQRRRAITSWPAVAAGVHSACR